MGFKFMRNGKNINCETCNELFYITPGRLKNNKHHTCSKECLGKLSSKLHSKKIKTNCTICDKELQYKQSHFKQIAQPTCSILCSSKVSSNRNKGNNNVRSLKLNEIERFFWDKAKNCRLRAEASDIPFDLDYEYLLDLYKKQDGKCYYSGLSMKLHSEKTRKSIGADFDVLSIDKIIPEKGYSKGNVVFSLNCVNMLKAHHSLEDFNSVCRAIYMKEKNNISVKVKKLYQDSILPQQSDSLAAGYDLTVHRFEEHENYIKVYTGIAIQPKLGNYFMIAPRSSIYKRGLTLYNNLGIIDINYTGELMGIFLKTPDYKNDIKIGERLMQLIPQEQIWAQFEEVQELSETERGEGGFGSTNT